MSLEQHRRLREIFDTALGRDPSEELSALEEVAPRAVRIVEMRFCGGFQEAETAEAVGVSVATLKRDRAFAGAWLLDRLNGGA